MERYPGKNSDKQYAKALVRGWLGDVLIPTSGQSPQQVAYFYGHICIAAQALLLAARLDKTPDGELPLAAEYEDLYDSLRELRRDLESGRFGSETQPMDFTVDGISVQAAVIAAAERIGAAVLRARGRYADCPLREL